MFEALDKFNIYKTRIAIPNNMVEQIYKLKNVDEGTPKTNYGGWHSKTFTPYKDYYNGRYKWTQHFIENITDTVKTKWPTVRFSRAWFNLSQEGGTNRWHDHGSHPLVSVFYIQVPEGSSSIEFEQNTEKFLYSPTEGDLLVFPGKLQHRVLTHNSKIDRISMAINFE